VSGKPVRPREQANRDIEAIIEHCLDEGSEKVALRFVDELQKTFGRISTNYSMGSPCSAYELDLPDLRFQPTARYPYLMFYIERDDHIDVWRVLHGERDIPVEMRTVDG
jgi:toxin ParE1/3/4